jgi:hypothetical protein
VWIVTRHPWPTLVNLSSLAAVAYQQPAKSDPRVRVVGVAWEQDHVLADCADGDEARRVVARIAAAIAAGRPLLDLNQADEAMQAPDGPASSTAD